MCHCITLIVPTEDIASVKAVMARHGRTANPIDNPSVRNVLHESEHQYLASGQTCDCGTALGRGHETTDAKEHERTKDAARLKRKGWSDAKIERALQDQSKADNRPRPNRPDSLDLWNMIINDLGHTLSLSYIGLFLRFYSGDISMETFKASRREVSRQVLWMDALDTMAEDEVTIFRLS